MEGSIVEALPCGHLWPNFVIVEDLAAPCKQLCDFLKQDRARTGPDEAEAPAPSPPSPPFQLASEVGVGVVGGGRWADRHRGAGAYVAQCGAADAVSLKIDV